MKPKSLGQGTCSIALWEPQLFHNYLSHFKWRTMNGTCQYNSFKVWSKTFMSVSDVVNRGPTSLITWKAAPSEIVKERLMTASKLRPIPVVYALIRGKFFDLIRFLRRLCCLWTGLCGVHAQYLQINRCTIPIRFSQSWQKAQISINLRSSLLYPSPFPSPVQPVDGG